MIVPTVGRRVYYKPRPEELSWQHNQPFDAGVLHVWSNTCVNVLVTNEQGKQFSKSSCTLAQDREPEPGECYWLPYQLQQKQA